ncbi:MAG: hypothetical protein ACRDOD_04125 [Streptosporangiaceae bacterium]
MTDAAAVAATYFDAWKARDFGRLRSVLATSVADPVPVANWMHIEDGKITRIRVAFDARGIAGGS